MLLNDPCDFLKDYLVVCFTEKHKSCSNMWMCGQSKAVHIRHYNLKIDLPSFQLLKKFVQAQFVKAEKNVKELSTSVDLMKKESRKLLERATLAEKDMNYGHTELM